MSARNHIELSVTIGRFEFYAQLRGGGDDEPGSAIVEYYVDERSDDQEELVATTQLSREDWVAVVTAMRSRQVE